jgi:cell fate regulator YaaT (PSP1 superfamily)
MTDVVGVRFKRAGKVYYFDPASIDLEVGDYVVVETARGQEMGRVVISPQQVLASEITEPLKPVVRKAEAADTERAREFGQKEQEAMEICTELITKLNLPMKLISAEYNFDGSRLTYSFSAEERVDFRQLVRELTGRFKIRVELRQIGPRDETKLMGGFGRCGRPLCCANFLGELAPVSIRMAKEQGLPLNPMKISGACGRLLCCLNYENDFYHEMRGKLPKEGQRVTTKMGEAKVIAVNPLREVVLVELESQATAELPVSEIVSVEPAPHKRTKKQVKK